MVTRQWYELRQAGFGAVFAQAFAHAIERMQAQPLSYPAAVGSIRRVILQRFPYAINFLIETDAIEVLAVHGRHDPGSWRKRIPQTAEPRDQTPASNTIHKAFFNRGFFRDLNRQHLLDRAYRSAATGLSRDIVQRLRVPAARCQLRTRPPT